MLRVTAPAAAPIVAATAAAGPTRGQDAPQAHDGQDDEFAGSWVRSPPLSPGGLPVLV